MTRLQDKSSEWNPNITHYERDKYLTSLVKELGDLVCAYTFENDIAELSLEIAQPMILEITKDQRVKYSDMVGTFGN